MASNTLGQSTPPAYSLERARSLDNGAHNFAHGECILVRMPESIVIGEHVDDEVTAVGTALPPTSNETGPQHLAFIRHMEVQPDNSYILEVYPVVSFSRSGGAVPAYNTMDDGAKALLLPLPPFSSRHPTPDAFGAPLHFGNWETLKDSFLLVVPIRFIMPTSRPFKRMNPPLYIPVSLLNRIKVYRGTLRSYTQSTSAQGDGGGQTTSGVTSVTNSPSIIGGKGPGEKAARAGFSVKSSHGLLVLEGVDEDAEGPDATVRDELMLLAYADPIWREELKQYLQKEAEEREQMQKERALRLAAWREGVVVQPT